MACEDVVMNLEGCAVMKIKKILAQLRRDFTAIYECEHCGYERKGYGYDDENFHQNVIPNMVCEGCDKKVDGDYQPLIPKYDEHQII